MRLCRQTLLVAALFFAFKQEFLHVHAQPVLASIAHKGLKNCGLGFYGLEPIC